MLEVEAKFTFTPEQKQRLIAGAKFLKHHTYHDVYYDTVDYRLTLQDWWLRNRNGTWEIKVSRPGQERNWTKRVVDQYDEITDEQSIIKKISLPADQLTADSLAANSYTPCCDITTERDYYQHGDFTLVFDEMDFGLTMGELELMVAGHDDGDAAKEKINQFLTAYGMSSDGSGAGKVVIYLQRFKPDHYRALQNAGYLPE